MRTGSDPPEDKVTAHKKNLYLLEQLISSNKFLAGNDLAQSDMTVLATLTIIRLRIPISSAYYQWSQVKNKIPVLRYSIVCNKIKTI